MPRETIIETDFFSLWYHPEEKIVHHQFHKFIFGKVFQDALTMGITLLQKHKAIKWLSDDRNNSALHPSDSSWSHSSWFPLALKAGWKYWAVVHPTSTIGRINMRDIVARCKKDGLVVQMFDNPDIAFEWLKSL